ncbi:hypothetical protein K9N08_02000 [Candidatus Gracilibacteria bacterium]|nr:hypothetical protein [Candidatus Gracilibacteria bacterium]MCF7856311.1 hypothetical protein [Candidatus Gracilibacteria bacterium]MCF7896666.1 hypothetical protein [Candidatus Gracilibacteria bacterium]
MDFSLIPSAFAENAVTYTDLANLNLFDVIYLFAALAILGAGALSIVFIFFGGFSFILSGGDEGKVKSAIHTIRYAIIGLVIALLSLVFVPIIGKLFGVNFNFFDFETLSNRINILFDQFQETDSTTIQQTVPAQTVPTTTAPPVALDDLVR